MNNENKSALGIITIIAVIILIGYSFLKTGYLDDYKKGDDTSPAKEETKQPNKTDEETKNVGTIEEIISTDVKYDLTSKLQIANLSFGDMGTKKYGSSAFYEYELYKNISDDRLLYGLISYLLLIKDESIVTIPSRDLRLYPNYPNILAYIDVNKLKEKSIYYLNKDLSNILSAPEDRDDYGTAWLGIVKDGDKYLISSAGGDPTPNDMAFIYPYKFEHDNVQAFVYVSATKGAIGEDGEKTVNNIYKGVKTHEVYKSFSEDEIDQYLNFKIDESNYQTFTKYKYIFDMVDGNYFFKGIEKVE